ncbi:MAG: hypothetical protein RBT47_11465 [Anaerolineae bacterium]|nr:hypothetical protein [Anaerolineae bacterium]
MHVQALQSSAPEHHSLFTERHKPEMLGKILKDIFATNKPPKNQASGNGAPPKVPLAKQAERGTILCFYGPSEGNALGQLTRELAAPFQQYAANIEYIDVADQNWTRKVNEALSSPIWFAMSFFGIGQHLNASNEPNSPNLWTACGIPFLRLYGDTPAYFPDRHLQIHCGSINGYFDRAHPEFYKRWFPAHGLTTLLPLTLLDTAPQEELNLSLKHRGKIIFPKNGNPPGELIDYWRLALPRPISEQLEILAEESCSVAWIDRDPCLADRLIQNFSTLGIDIASEPAALLFLIAQLDDYLRRVKSTMIAESLLDLPVIIRGKSWQHVNFTGKQAIQDPDSDMGRTQRLIDQAPAVIDMSPNKQYSAHDRIRRAAGRWTAFLTNETEFFNTLLPSPERFTFKFERQAIRACVEHYALHPEEAVELGIEQGQRLREIYTDAAYVHSVEAAVAVSAMRMMERPLGTQPFVDFPPKHFGKYSA